MTWLVLPSASTQKKATSYTPLLSSSRRMTLPILGRWLKRKLQITVKEFTSALARIPDAEFYPELPTRLRDVEMKDAEIEDLYPELSSDARLTEAATDLPSNIYIKRPKVADYDEYQAQDAFEVLRCGLLQEAWTMEVISRRPHPGVLGYHGCRVHRGFVTGLVLDRHISDLENYIEDKTGFIDKGPFMEALKSAVDHIHSLGRAHNDITPRNILVNIAGMLVLADFDSCLPVGKKLTYSRGTPGWIEEDKSYTTSETHHNTFAIQTLQAWLDEKTAGS